MRRLLAIEALRVSRGAREVLRGVDLEVSSGEVCGLMGLSGSGKSTILRACAALEPFDGGRIEIDGAALASGPVPPESRLRALRRAVGMVFQAHALFENLTALENVALAPIFVLRMTRPDAERRATQLLESLGVALRSGAYPRELSGGEAQRVAIARALAPDPPLLLMDEPTAALDPARRGSLAQVLRSLAAEGRGILVATHDTDFAREAAHQVAVLADGVIVEEGPAARVLDEPSHAATRELLQRQTARRP